MSDWERERRQREAQRRSEVLALPVLRLLRHGGLKPSVPGDVLVSASVGPAGEAVAVWSTAAGKDTLTSSTTAPGGATFPDARAADSVPVRVSVDGAGRSAVTSIAKLPLAHVMAQPLPGGRILAVGARCRSGPDGPERNAIVYDLEGSVLAEHTLGDGIEHVQATSDGQVWVGYFDEGVYGTHGWDDPDSPAPLGESGLVRFSAELQPAWRFPSSDDGTWDSIDDCYALNVVGDDAWTCYYSDFPVVRVRDGALTSWTNTLAAGARALVVSDTHVALCGGYGPDRDRLAVAFLGDGDLQPVGECRLVLPDGSDLPRDAVVVGRGADLHVFVGQDWHRLDLKLIAGAAAPSQ